jgi:hypothetical protein
MNEGIVGIIVLLGLSAGVAIGIHLFYPRFFLACLFSAATATVLFQAAAYFHLGHLDPFFPIAVAVGGSISFIVALGVGALIRLARRKRS